MAATNYYLSIPNRENIKDDFDNSGLDQGSSSTATDFIELRILTIKADGVTATNVTKRDVLIALEVFKRWIIEGGKVTSADANLPIL